MANYKTPGVYVEEISKLPASVAAVETAIPAFIGYTEMRVQDGTTLGPNTPVRITSLLEFEEIFGNAFDEEIDVLLEDDASDPDATIITVTPTNPNLSFYTLYYNMVMYYSNGGGPCYVVSVGTTYANQATPPASSDIQYADLKAGLDALEKEDEVTLLVVPEAIVLGDANRKTMNDDMVTQCNKLQDRFAILDAQVLGGTVFNDGIGFRADIGIDYLKYGAAYYPSLNTLINLNYEDADVTIDDDRAAPDQSYDALSLDVVFSGVDLTSATATVTVGDTNLIGAATLNVNGTVLSAGVEWTVTVGDADATATSLAAAVDALGNVGATATDNVVTITASTAGAAGNSITLVSSHPSNLALSGGTLTGGSDLVTEDKGLYNDIVAAIKDTFDVTLYPSATMAGVFARVDNDRGVWKAPANVGVNMVKDLSVLVTADEQKDMNVHTTGKSINVIRKFSGKGFIVWGARTLAGNDNEWRYVPVRRLFNFVEESVKKATEFVVFEPNDANTWLRTKGMIENFLTILWRDGALAGAKTEDAFFVRVGLGETMTSLDILEGRMNIEIGMAAVRPAEFIILKFSHKLQES